MNLLRLLLILLLGWLLARGVKLYLERKTGRNPGGKLRGQGRDTATDLEKCPQCGSYVAKGQPHSCSSRPSGPAAMLLLLAAFWAFPASAEASSGGRYLVEVSGSQVHVEVEINGIRAESWQLGSNTTAGASLNHWLRRGNNTLTLRAAPVAGGRASLKARVYFLGIAANGATNVVSLLELGDMSRAQQGASVSFNLASAPTLALWQAQPAPAALTNDQALSLVTTLREELVSVMAVGGGFEDVRSLELERSDMLRAFGSAATLEPLASAPQSPQAKLEVTAPPQSRDLELSPLEGGGLIRIAQRDKIPLIAIRRGGQVAAVPSLVVGWVGGAWQILRRAN